MSCYSLTDPRDGRVRYVGRSAEPRRRLKRHVWRSHSEPMRDWIAELSAMGLSPCLALLGPGSEREWIARLGPDLNIVQGRAWDDGDEPGEIVTIRISQQLKRAADALASRSGQSLNFWIATAIDMRVKAEGESAEQAERDRDKKKGTR